MAPHTPLIPAKAGIQFLSTYWLWVPAFAGTSGTRIEMLVDSHCHLDFPDFAAELDAIVARAEAAGVGRMVTISTRVKRHAQILAIAERVPNVTCPVGTPPPASHDELHITTTAP